jgi:hypothetical protein
MKSGLFATLIAVSLTFTATEAASAGMAQKPLQAVTSGDVTPQKDAQAARPFSAVLRYGPGTTAVCHGLPDNSAAICLLLALHVMELSQKTVAETKL